MSLLLIAAEFPLDEEFFWTFQSFNNKLRAYSQIFAVNDVCKKQFPSPQVGTVSTIGPI